MGDTESANAKIGQLDSNVVTAIGLSVGLASVHALGLPLLGLLEGGAGGITGAATSLAAFGMITGGWLIWLCNHRVSS